MASHANQKLAVLIDADNAQASVIRELLEEVSRYGTATIKRAYGDWTTTNLKGWKEVLHTMAVQPIQQFSYTSGKNATDSALIIYAMDVLHTGRVDGFCLVSSDSDFTRLATRIREVGLVVYGFGERKTPEPFVAACDKFVYTEILRVKPEEKKPDEVSTSKLDGEVKAAAVAELPKLKPLVVKALEAVARDDGWFTLSALGAEGERLDACVSERGKSYWVASLKATSARDTCGFRKFRCERKKFLIFVSPPPKLRMRMEMQSRDCGGFGPVEVKASALSLVHVLASRSPSMSSLSAGIVSFLARAKNE